MDGEPKIILNKERISQLLTSVGLKPGDLVGKKLSEGKPVRVTLNTFKAHLNSPKDSSSSKAIAFQLMTHLYGVSSSIGPVTYRELIDPDWLKLHPELGELVYLDEIAGEHSRFSMGDGTIPVNGEISREASIDTQNEPTAELPVRADVLGADTTRTGGNSHRSVGFDVQTPMRSAAIFVTIATMLCIGALATTQFDRDFNARKPISRDIEQEVQTSPNTLGPPDPFALSPEAPVVNSWDVQLLPIQLTTKLRDRRYAEWYQRLFAARGNIFLQKDEVQLIEAYTKQHGPAAGSRCFEGPLNVPMKEGHNPVTVRLKSKLDGPVVWCALTNSGISLCDTEVDDGRSIQLEAPGDVEKLILVTYDDRSVEMDSVTLRLHR